MIKYIITDFDGTLVNTLEANKAAYGRAFQKLGIAGWDSKKYERIYGVRFDKLCEAFNVPSKLGPELKAEKARQYINFIDLTELNNNLVSTLRNLKHGGIKICLASTASTNNLYNILNCYDISDIFDYIISGDNVTHGKPHPDVYIQAAKVMGIEDPNEVIVFEDTEIGIEAAEGAGFENIVKIKM